MRAMQNRWLTAGLLGLLLMSGTNSALPTWAKAPDGDYRAGVQLYRQGQYTDAAQYFEQLANEHPDDSRVVYYQAISQVQLGHYNQARDLYNRVVLLDPNSPAAQLAQEGLARLPGPSAGGGGLDAPPGMTAGNRPTGATTSPMMNPYGNSLPTTGQATTPAASLPAGMDPQAWNQQLQSMMMMQMMSGLNGGNGGGSGGGNNPVGWMMPWMMMNGGGGGAAPNTMDPALMSQMMMNQMMSGMDFSPSSDK